MKIKRSDLKRKLIASIIIINCFFVLSSQNSKEKYSKINEVIDRAVELEMFSGTVLIAKKGEIIFSRAAGYANKDFSIKNTIDTKFNIGSIGKSITSTAIMVLAQKGLLKMSDPVNKHLSDFPFGKDITIHHLLTHTAGLGNYLSNVKYTKQKTVQELLQIVYKEKLIFKKPGVNMLYSNSGAIVAGAIIETISGLSYSDFLSKYILIPVGMKNSHYKSPEEIVRNRSVGYIKKMKGGFINNTNIIHPPSPAGGLLSTVGDLLLFDQVLYRNDLLIEKYKKILFTPYKYNYACFWGVSNKRLNNTIIGHAGGAPGINAWFRRYINDKFTIIILSNYDEGAESIFWKLEAIIFEKKYTLPRIPVGEFLYSSIKKEGFDKINRNINLILKNNKYRIRNSEILNSFGYRLITQKDINMALKIFILNSFLFKNNANVLDSIGEVYMLKGNIKEALNFYKKALKIDPNYANAKNAKMIIEKY